LIAVGRVLRNLPTVFSVPDLLRATRLFSRDDKAILFVTSLLRAREIKMAAALRRLGRKVVLIYLRTTPFTPEDHFDIAIRARSEAQAHLYADVLSPRICHVFSGAVDGLVLRFCRDKPSPVVIDLNDIFCPSLFDYLHERFEQTREVLEKATALCARDLQANFAERLDGFRLPRYKILFPEYAWGGDSSAPNEVRKQDSDEVHVVSVGTFTLEKQNMYDSAHLKIAERFAEQRIHFHVYPHWFYRWSIGSSFNFSPKRDFSDFFELAKRTPYVHMHSSLGLQGLARELPKYDFGIIAGGCDALGQKLKLLKPNYMQSCYSGRIADYLDARLPILINREVGFNHWLLNRYGVAVELEGLLEPGFRDKLLAIKRDPARGERLEKAAHALSIDKHIGRLAELYDAIIDEDRRTRVRIGSRWSAAKMLPIVGGSIRTMETAVQHLNDEVLDLRNQLAQQRAQAGRRQHSLAASKARLQTERGAAWADELSGLLNWSDMQDRAERTSGMAELMEMVELFGATAGPLHHLSSCWNVLGFKNINQLLSHGYRNFKRTLGTNYFNFLVRSGDPQLAFLEENVDEAELQECRQLAKAVPPDPAFDWGDQTTYWYFVAALWAYARKVDTNGYLDRLEEPSEGNPLTVTVRGSQRAAQDLANSVIEYYSINEGMDVSKCRRVLEIGGGYGRNAYVMLKLNPHLQYVMVDIPPTLWVAQRYLSSVFKERAVFRVRDFRSFEDVREEMEEASIVCLLPHQLALLPDQRFDLGINISSFAEMEPTQIRTYFSHLARVVRGGFYMKQWKVSKNAFDRITLTEADYPVPAAWKKRYSRTARVQTEFFEAFYDAGSGA
jgi:putative sugar O-methyltransferase